MAENKTTRPRSGSSKGSTGRSRPSKKALEAAVEAIKTALVEGDKVQLIGFGTFSVNERPAREGMNLRTGEKIQIAAKKVAKFKAGAELTAALN